MLQNLSIRSKCSNCAIRHSAVCARCDAAELLALEKIKSDKTFVAGEAIVWRGDRVNFVGSVVSGVASLSKTLEDGRTQTVGLLLPSDFIGRPGREEIDFDVTAVTDVTLCTFERKPFEKMMVSTPHIAHRLIELSLDELDASRDWMLLLGRKSAREKIATFIRMIVQRHVTGSEDEALKGLTLPLNRSEIANYLGLTLETVSRQFSAFQKDGTLAFSDRMHFDVCDLAALENATGDGS